MLKNYKKADMSEALQIKRIDILKIYKTNNKLDIVEIIHLIIFTITVLKKKLLIWRIDLKLFNRKFKSKILNNS